jgi:hypothetical protein
MAWIMVMDLNILRDKGIVYGKKLLVDGVSAEIKAYKGTPHPIMATYHLDSDCAPLVYMYSKSLPFCI